MVSTKLALAMGAATLLQLTSARDCTALMAINTAAMPTYQGVEVRFSDNDELLDYQDTDNTDGLNIFDGWQTLKSDKLGGDVRLKAKGEVGLIQSCEVDFMEEHTQGKADDGTCEITFKCAP